MSLMPTRYLALKAVVAGQELGAPPLVGYVQGQYEAPLWYEEPGLLYFVPKIMDATGLDLPRAIDAFLTGVTALGFAAGLAGFWRLISTWMGRVAVAAGLLALTVLTLKISDLYVVHAAIAMGLVPWFLVLRARAQFARRILGWLAVAGIVIGAANQTRYHAGTAVLIFANVLLLGHAAWTRAQRTLGVVLILAGTLLSTAAFTHLQNERDSFLAQNNPAAVADRRGHVFWHSVYIGLGYLPNRHGIQYLDESAIAAVNGSDPAVAYCSQAYEDILRAKVLGLLRGDPVFLLQTALAKLGVLAWYLLWASNLGLWLAFRYRKPGNVDAAFGLTLAFNALFGLLTMPFMKYCLGFIAMAALFGIVSIGHALEHGLLADVRAWCHRRA